MYIIIKQFHSFTAYLSLLFISTAIVWAFYGWFTNKDFNKNSRIISLLGLVGAHSQMLIGFILYFVSPLGLSNFSGDAMKNASTRLYILEHPLTMILAIGLITFAHSKAKKLDDSRKKHKLIAVFYTLALILILLRIPWEVWVN